MSDDEQGGETEAQEEIKTERVKGKSALVTSLIAGGFAMVGAVVGGSFSYFQARDTNTAELEKVRLTTDNDRYLNELRLEYERERLLATHGHQRSEKMYEVFVSKTIPTLAKAVTKNDPDKYSEIKQFLTAAIERSFADQNTRESLSAFAEISLMSVVGANDYQKLRQRWKNEQESFQAYKDETRSTLAAKEVQLRDLRGQLGRIQVSSDEALQAAKRELDELAAKLQRNVQTIKNQETRIGEIVVARDQCSKRLAEVIAGKQTVADELRTCQMRRNAQEIRYNKHCNPEPIKTQQFAQYLEQADHELESADMQLQQGDAQKAQHHLNRAMHRTERALAIAPENLEAGIKKALIRSAMANAQPSQRMQNLVAAIDDITKVIELEPTAADEEAMAQIARAFYNRACFHAKTDRPGAQQSVLRDLKAAIQRNQKYATTCRTDDDFAAVREDKGFEALCPPG